MASAPITRNRPCFDQAGLTYRPASGRFHSKNSWLDSLHSFSFANHYDPEWCGFGPLRVINEDRIQAGNGFGMHPHADMEIITVMLEGELHHQDSMGHSEALRCGEVQRMSAGRGIVHSETNPSAAPCHLLQIWIEPSAAGLSPSYLQKPFTIVGGWTLLIDPQGQGEAMAINRPVRLWRARAAAGQKLGYPVAPEAQGWIQMIAGEIIVNEAAANETAAAWTPVAQTPADQTATGETAANEAPAGAKFPGPSVLGAGEGVTQAPIAVGPTIGVLSQGDGLGFPPGRWISLEAGDQGADLLLFELR
jgi:redox-sensitive bicupin YhaK (pirin superfamily)